MTTNQTKREPQAIARTRIKRKKPQVNVLFERGEGAKQRLPSRRQMTFWIQAAAERPLELCVRFVSPEEGRELNKMYRGKDYATNVLTFDYEHEPVDNSLGVTLFFLLMGYPPFQGASEAELMEQKEREIMNELGFDDPYYDAARGH